MTAGHTIVRYGLTFKSQDQFWTGQFDSLNGAVAQANSLAPTGLLKPLHRLNADERGKIPDDEVGADFLYVFRGREYVGLIQPEIFQSKIVGEYHAQ